jgi:hypothetical protein
MLMLFHLHVGKTVLASSTGADKGSRGKDVRLQEPSADVEGALAHEIGVVDIVLASRHGGAISRDAVCGLLTECL